MREFSVWMRFFILLISAGFPLPICAQNFGRNKVHYTSKNFRIEQTPHFRIYHYFKNDSVIDFWAREAESWYHKEQQIFRDTFETRNPVILYANHPDFQQTNTVNGLIGTGTGGVTEELKRRVVLPVTMVNAQTEHVLGHELVHAFQYHMLLRKNLRGLNNIKNIPLWMIEGLAEYISLGSKDPNTAMWMRDVVMNHDIPGLKDLIKGYKYFPYRYGQAFWAFVGGIWGDSTIAPLFRKTARLGYKSAIKDELGVTVKTFSGMWKSAFRTHYLNAGRDSVDNVKGRLIISGKNAGNINISPALSPNGNQLAFISNKDIFTNDVYLADARTGKIEKKLYSTVSNSHINAISYIESGITWSPQNNRLAIVEISKGQNILTLIDAGKRSKVKEIKIPGIPAFSYPAWSPDGKMIAITGMVDGQSNLYLYNLKNNSVFKLTDDGYSEIEPSWSPDGNHIVFSTDRPPANSDSASGGMRLADLNLNTGTVKVIDVFNGASNLNPEFSKDGHSIYFLSDRDGFRDLYRYDIPGDEVFQLTQYFTGISGITPYSPAISISAAKNKIIYTYFSNHKYRLYSTKLSNFSGEKVKKDSLNSYAAILPGFTGDSIKNIVNHYLASNIPARKIPEDSLQSKPYKSRFRLDYIGNTGGIGTSYGGLGNRTEMYGGANAVFSDILGNNYLFTGLQLNGRIYDFAGMASYLNRAGRIGWGVTGSHIPYRYSTLGFGTDQRIKNQDTLNLNEEDINTDRMFEENIGLMAYYPFSQTTRMEIGGNFKHYSYRIDQDRYYYLNGILYDYQREKLTAPTGFNLETMGAAFVKDNSYFGLTSPEEGFRYRIGISRYFGRLNMYKFLADFRKYFFINPFTVACRILHYARLGQDAENNLLYPLTFAYPSLTHGNQFTSRASDSTSLFNLNQIYGSRILVANLEFRIPLTGPKRLAFITSHMIFSELSLFLDAGLAWNRKQMPLLDFIPENPVKRVPYYTTGLSYRINLFGYLVVEPYLAFPLQKSRSRKITFGVNLTPGW